MKLSSIFSFVSEVRREGARVVWPSRPEVVASTIMVLLMVSIFAVFFLVVDTIASKAIQYILS